MAAVAIHAKYGDAENIFLDLLREQMIITVIISNYL